MSLQEKTKTGKLNEILKSNSKYGKCIVQVYLQMTNQKKVNQQSDIVEGKGLATLKPQVIHVMKNSKCNKAHGEDYIQVDQKQCILPTKYTKQAHPTDLADFYIRNPTQKEKSRKMLGLQNSQPEESRHKSLDANHINNGSL